MRRLTRGIDLRRAAPGDHAGIRVRSDHGDGVHRVGIEWQQAAGVFEQDDALLRDVSRGRETTLYINDAFLRGVIEESGLKLDRRMRCA